MRRYKPIPESEVPSGLRFDIPRSNQGQIVEHSYADFPRRASEAGSGSRYKRVYDRSDRSVAFYRLVGCDQ